MIFRQRPGHALVVLLIFMGMAMVVTLTAVGIGVAGLQTASNLHVGQSAYLLAESGVEEALLAVLRDPNYTTGTLTTDHGTATINVTGQNPKTLEITAVAGGFTRRIRVIANLDSGILTVQSYNEF